MGNKNKHAKKLLNRMWKTGEKVTCFAVRLSLIQLYLYLLDQRETDSRIILLRTAVQIQAMLPAVN